MRLLFDMDRQDHEGCTRTFARHSARSIIIRDGRLAMVRSGRYGYYKFPGGGIEPGEDPATAMQRETREEAGLVVRPETIRPYGYVHRVQRSDYDPSERFVQDNFYYLCDAEDAPVPQQLDDYEDDENFTPVLVEPTEAIRANRSAGPTPHGGLMLEREARVIELLLAEGILNARE